MYEIWKYHIENRKDFAECKFSVWSLDDLTNMLKILKNAYNK